MDDASVLALEAGEDMDMLDSSDALELDDEAEEGSQKGKAGKGKQKPKVGPDFRHPASMLFCVAQRHVCSLHAAVEGVESRALWSRWYQGLSLLLRHRVADKHTVSDLVSSCISAACVRAVECCAHCVSISRTPCG